MRLFTIIADKTVKLTVYADNMYHAIDKALYSYPKYNMFRYKSFVRTRN